MGGNLINYPDDCGTPTANLLTVKLMFNRIISTPGAKFMTIDIKDFYLMTPMDRFEYFRMKLDLFPQDIIDEYGLRNKSQQRWQRLLQGGTRDVRSPTGRHYCPKPPHQMTTHSRLPPEQSYTRILAPQLVPNQLHPHRRQLWSEVH